MIAAAALLLVVDLVATSHHHRPLLAQPPQESSAQSDIRLGKKYCQVVAAARALGLTDDQIIAMAVARGISPGMIIWAKKNCVAANK